MVPVIRNVEGMNFADIEKAINLLGEKVNIDYYFLITCLKSLVYNDVIHGHVDLCL